MALVNVRLTLHWVEGIMIYFFRELLVDRYYRAAQSLDLPAAQQPPAHLAVIYCSPGFLLDRKLILLPKFKSTDLSKPKKNRTSEFPFKSPTVSRVLHTYFNTL